MSNTLAIDFGSKNVGIALVEHTEAVPNRVLYAATLVVEAKPLNAAVAPRALARRMRRTRKTHRRRLSRLAQALTGIEGADQIVRFCRRRGYSYDPEENDDDTKAFRVPRAEFFTALRGEIDRVIAPYDHGRVLRACSRHLNETRNRDAEIRPARFENRGPTRCQWEGCRHNVPRAHNAFKERLQQALYAWLKPIFDESGDPQRLRRSVDHWISELDGLARWFRKTDNLADELAEKERKRIGKRKNRVYKNLREGVCRESSEKSAAQFKKNWSKTYSRNLTEIVKGKAGGRIRYCRKHSGQFVDYFLAGRQIPNRTEVSEADLFGRKQQILFTRIWRLVESRLLPLAGGRIDRVVVERVAFDVLAGKAKKRRELSESTAAEMYWRGPQYGFASRREMLREEFAGRCAYCGQEGGAEEVEHLLPRSQFPFDSYFNVLPACTGCNTQKGARTAFEAGMSIHEDSYTAYARYVDGLAVPHVFHTMKKGMLKLLSRNGKSSQVEQHLGMLANNLVTISNTQKGPRPLARYLAGRLQSTTNFPCEPSWGSGRHTALYRMIMLPEYDKERSDLSNHAVDAIILGCKVPSAAELENRRWYARAQDINAWREKVRALAPGLEGGLPRVEPVAFIPHFEQDLGNGYCTIDLSAFNWNRTRQSGHKLDPVGRIVDGRLIKREPATKVLGYLRDSGKRDDQIRRIAHPALRKLLKSDPQHAAEGLIRWLQQTTKAGLSQGAMGSHPSDEARKELLEEFVNCPIEKFLADQTNGQQDIPQTIGVRCLSAGYPAMFDVSRCDREGRVFQHYKADPRLKALYVGYRLRNGAVNRSRPIKLCVNQVYVVTLRRSSGEVPVDVPADSPLRGRPLGSKGSLKEFLAGWQAAFDAFCRQEEIVERFCITQGCVIEKTDGTYFELRNFTTGDPWMKGSPFRDIHRVHKSPLRFLGQVHNQDAIDCEPDNGSC